MQVEQKNIVIVEAKKSMAGIASRGNSSQPSPARYLELPFDQEQELCWKLLLDKDQNGIARAPSKREIPKDWLPGDPRARLDDLRLGQLLHKEYSTPKLDGFSRYLWLVGRPDSAHIASLTRQLVRGRRIVVTDDPEMHLVWIHDRVFVKPLPEYLLSQTFWEHYFHRPTCTFKDAQEATAVREAALGFLRTYAYLIQHKSDFELATRGEHRLICNKIRFSSLIRLLDTVRQRTTDDLVTSRWRYGELRLSRLNFWCRLLLRHHNFAKVHGQYSEYVAQFYAPLLFVFAVISVILSAMQVGLVLDRRIAGHNFVLDMTKLSKVFVPLSLLIVAIAMAWFVVTIMAVLARVIFLGIRTQLQSLFGGRCEC